MTLCVGAKRYRRDQRGSGGMADALVSEASGPHGLCRFKSCDPHHCARGETRETRSVEGAVEQSVPVRVRPRAPVLGAAGGRPQCRSSSVGRAPRWYRGGSPVRSRLAAPVCRCSVEGLRARPKPGRFWIVTRRRHHIGRSLNGRAPGFHPGDARSNRARLTISGSIVYGLGRLALNQQERVRLSLESPRGVAQWKSACLPSRRPRGQDPSPRPSWCLWCSGSTPLCESGSTGSCPVRHPTCRCGATDKRSSVLTSRLTVRSRPAAPSGHGRLGRFIERRRPVYRVRLVVGRETLALAGVVRIHDPVPARRRGASGSAAAF